jgi:hypothetical protein
MTHLCFVRTSMSDAILSHCSSAAVARQQNLTNYGREGSISTAIPQESASSVVRQHNKIGAIAFGAPGYEL